MNWEFTFQLFGALGILFVFFIEWPRFKQRLQEIDIGNLVFFALLGSFIAGLVIDGIASNTNNIELKTIGQGLWGLPIAMFPLGDAITSENRAMMWRLLEGFVGIILAVGSLGMIFFSSSFH